MAFDAPVLGLKPKFYNPIQSYIVFTVIFFYIFQIDSFVLVEWELEGNRGQDTVVFYVGKVVSIMEDGHYVIKFLRMKNHYTKDTFIFPEIEDVIEVVRSRVLGVLTPCKATTQRQANIVKIFPPLLKYNMR